jgi:U3 small nucleolar RNA-associated protein MPP10
MLDGFFDLQEMEAFADEEEAMLPDDAFGEEDDDGGVGGDGKKNKKVKKDKKGMLPHLRDRLGDDSEGDDDDDDDDDDEDPLAKRFQPTTVRRKNYRADDEVDALCECYICHLIFCRTL